MDPGPGGAGEDIPEPGNAGQRLGQAAHKQRRQDRCRLRSRRKSQTGSAGAQVFLFDPSKAGNSSHN